MKKYLLIIFLIFIVSGLYGSRSYYFTRYRTEDGLQQKTVNSILQDGKGYMWFATWDGLYKFDGYEFSAYKAHPGDSVMLSNNRIDYMSAQKNHIWLQNYDNQIYRFDSHSEKFHSLPIEKSYEALRLYALGNGEVWISMKDGSLVRVKDSGSGEMAVNTYFDGCAGSVVNNVTLDADNNVWVLSGNGLFLQRSGADRLESMEVRRAWAFHGMLEAGGRIYFTSDNGAVYVYEKARGGFDKLQLPTGSQVCAVNRINDRMLIFGTSSDGFVTYDTEEKIFRHYTTDGYKGLTDNSVRSIYVDSRQKAWLGLGNEGITLFDYRTEKISHFVVKDISGNTLNSQPSVFIHEDINGWLWVHPSGGGFSYYDRERNVLVPFFNPRTQSGWTSANRMSAIFSDRQGNLWMSSYNNGLEKVTFTDTKFGLHVPYAADEESQRNNVRALLCDRDGNIWVGAKDGSLNIYGSDYKFKGFLSGNGTLSARQDGQIGIVYSMLQDSRGIIWLGTKGDGLLRLEPDGKGGFGIRRFKHDGKDVFSISDDNIYSIYEGRDGRIWLATYGGGINIVSEKGREVRFLNHANLLKSYPVSECRKSRFVTGDNDGNIWIGTTSGLLRAVPEDKPEDIQFSRYIRYPEKMNSLSNNDVHSILVSEAGELYVGTFGGGINRLISFDGAAASFRTYTTKDGLSSDIILSMQEDGKGNIWLATESELCRFSPADSSFENYNDRYFPVQMKFSEGVPAKTGPGDFVFSTNRGFMSFNPEEVYKSDYSPAISLIRLRIGDKESRPNDKSSPLEVNVDNTGRLKLKHKENSFSVRYAALDMTFPENIRYAYKLDGFEKEWNYVGSQRTATYTNIPKGKYTLMIMSTNSDGVWADNVRSLNIEILPSFRETAWAYLLYVLIALIIVMAAAYILFTIYRLKNEVSVEQKISNVKLQFFTNISHELRTPLTLISGPVEHVLRKPGLDDESREQLALVGRNTNRMLRLVNQILDFRKIQNNKMKMKVREFELVGFVRRIMESFSQMADEHHIDFTLEAPSRKVKVWADADKVENILFNLLSNAFKFSLQGKSIVVYVGEEQDNIVMSVKDQGIGIDENKQRSLFVRFENLVDERLFNVPSTGIGLSMVKELVEMHGGKIEVESKPGEGSRFTVSLPKGKGHFPKDTEFIFGDSQPDGVMEDIYDGRFALPDDGSFMKNKERQTILLVEDNPELRYFMHTIFADDFNVITAVNGNEGFRKAVEFNPDLIVSDIMMPEKDGIELTKELRDNMSTSHIPIILLTAKSGIDSKIEGMRYGADDYITKPFSAVYLRARIFNLLEQRKKLQSLYLTRIMSQEDPAEKPEDTLSAVSPNDRLFMKEVLAMLEANLDNNGLVIEDLARNMGMSRSVFFKKLKSLTGVSPVEFVKEFRIKEAARLIGSGDYNVSQVAYMVGFNDPHYFSKCFKQFYGMTPTEYKENTGGVAAD